MPTLLAFIPHPDDESYSFGGTIALAAQAGWRCRVECVTSGEGGQRHDSGPTGRQAVGRAREAELTHSCRILHAEPPSFWKLPDGGLRDLPSQSKRVADVCRELRPDLVLTLGSDGAYGHPDHIQVYRWVLEGWRLLQHPRPVLLLAAFPKGLFIPQYEKCLGMMGNPPSPGSEEIGAAPWQHEVDVRAVSDEKLAAIRAHRSQLPGGHPESLFPSGIVRQLLAVERFGDADASQSAAASALLASLAVHARSTTPRQPPSIPADG